MRALTLFALLYTGPALAGINVWNDYAGYHSSATNSRGFRFVIHCQKDGASSVCGNQTVTLESSDIDDAGVLPAPGGGCGVELRRRPRRWVGIR